MAEDIVAFASSSEACQAFKSADEDRENLISVSRHIEDSTRMKMLAPWGQADERWNSQTVNVYKSLAVSGLKLHKSLLI